MGNSGSAEPKTRFQQIFDTEGEDAFVKALWEEIVDPEDFHEFRGMEFDFDCLAFEGGGVKGTAYVGAVKVLEELGILKKIKRYAGTSAGAYMAMQLAIGMPIDNIFKTNGIPSLEETFYDSSSWFLPYNILRGYGWQSGNKLLLKIEDDLEKYLGDRNATFLDLYQKRGVELCVVVTDLNGRNIEYCHPKTVPGLKIADAVRTSMSLPFLFAPTVVKELDMERYFVDGGLLENYPIRVFDGWYLSMKKEDDFFVRMADKPETKFLGFNKKMLGMVVFSYEENQSNSHLFLNRYGDKLHEGRPDSKLSKEREYTRDSENLDKDKKERLEESAKEIVKYIATNLRDKADEHGTFTFEAFQEIIKALQDDRVMSLYLDSVVGPEGLRPLDKSFGEMDINKDRRLTLVECLTYLQKKGVYLRYNLKARRPQKIECMAGYITSIIGVMQSYISELQEKADNQSRTIGIYTDYITTTDFDMTLDDKVYLLRQGYKAAISYLKTVKK